MNEKDTPAFPTPEVAQCPECFRMSKPVEGMTLRDYFAAAALTGICANSDISEHAALAKISIAEIRENYAASAYLTADAMLTAREAK